MIRSTHVASSEGYVAAIRRLTARWDERWFRGHTNARWPLVPGAFRKRTYGFAGEADARDQFELRAPLFLSDALAQTTHEPENSWEWYFLMQHYGIPTRLLDWSESALTALYFALDGNERHDRCVWILEPHDMNKNLHNNDLIFTYHDDPVPRYLSKRPTLSRTEARRFLSQLPSSPAAIAPPFTTRRIAAQRGQFTLHGQDRAPLEDLPKLQRHLVKLIIPAARVRSMREDLAWAGVTRTSVFPELTALALEVLESP